jgi:hypothetical protein
VKNMKKIGGSFEFYKKIVWSPIFLTSGGTFSYQKLYFDTKLYFPHFSVIVFVRGKRDTH